MSKEQNLKTEGIVLRVERGSVYDGRGFRTVVYLKGCPLRCMWCSTPESHKVKIQSTTKNIYGEVISVEKLLRTIIRDTVFYYHSGGGLTLSGGEPLFQSDFALAILEEAKCEHINTALETSFHADWDIVKEALKFTDSALVDIKMMDSKRHKYYCGQDNELILDNLLKTNDLKEDFDIVIRIPLIPTLNDSVEELTKMGKFIQKLNKVSHAEILPYHRLGVDTYKEMGIDYKLPHIKSPERDQLKKSQMVLNQYVNTIIG